MSQLESWSAMILAAGSGTRMKSSEPKVLHRIAGRPLVAFPITAALKAGAERVVLVVGQGREQVEKELAPYIDARVTTSLQPAQLGTGDAVTHGLTGLGDWEGWVVILYGDVPLIRSETIEALVERARSGGTMLAMITGVLSDPMGYGRIIRDNSGYVVAIREHRDCSEEELGIDEVNPGVYAVRASFLRHSLSKLSTNNAQGELYLTDVVSMAARSGGVVTLEADMSELRGVNDRFELSQADKALQRRLLKAHCLLGVTVQDADATYVDVEVQLSKDCVLERGVTLRGKTVVEERAIIDVGCVLENVHVQEGAWVRPYTVAQDCQIGPNAKVGPFAHLRPGTQLGPDVHVGNFVETKKTIMGRGSKANHLSYLGDAQIGEEVNIGAGTIFCNYDGVNKHVTVLEDHCFIGSDSQLIAPVRVGQGAYVATGTTVRTDVPPNALAIGRVRAEIKEGYASRLRARLSAEKDKDTSSVSNSRSIASKR